MIAPDHAAVERWRDIETAPKSAVPVMVWVPGRGWFVAEFDAVGCCDWFIRLPGISQQIAVASVFGEPTHWRPLPPPPRDQPRFATQEPTP